MPHQLDLIEEGYRMAITLTKELESGVSVDYLRVDNVSILRGNNINFQIWCYISKEVRDLGKSPVTQMMYSVPCPTDMTNIFTFIYNYLKSLPEFENAIDS